MKTSLQLVLLFIIMLCFKTSFAQKSASKTPTLKIPATLDEGVHFLKKIGNVNFYTHVDAGKLVALTAENAVDKHPLTVSYEDQNTPKDPITQTCEVCYWDFDDNDNLYSRTCVMVDCKNIKDIVHLTSSSTAEMPTLKFSSEPTTGKVSISKNAEHEIFAEYKEGKIIGYSAVNFKGNKTFVQWINTYDNTTIGNTVCSLKVCTTIDGHTSCNFHSISCDRVPKEPKKKA